MSLPRGPVVLGVEGTSLSGADRERLMHPLVGGVILFTRNYEGVQQLDELTAQIRALRSPSLLISVDHEGGRVQRFRDGFTAVPPMRTLGELWERDPEEGEAEALRWGSVIARELRAHGIDFSFTPVLDVDFGNSAVIGDRAFAADPVVIAQLASSLCDGLRAGGCAAVGKHFPGHGFVAADSHHEVPVDERPLADLFATDLIPFLALAKAGLEAVMPAHVIYPAVDDKPAGFSRVWIEDILRERLRFDGLVFSDDLGMAGACVAGDIVARADAAIDAGCDMVLTCNEFDAADELLTKWKPRPQPHLQERAQRMTGR